MHGFSDCEVYHVGDLIKCFFWGIVKCIRKFGGEGVNDDYMYLC